MKRYFIILIALIVLFALPVFAGTPTPENAPATSEEDAWLWLSSLSEEELIQIFRDVIKDVSGNKPYFEFDVEKGKVIEPGDEYINFYWADGEH